MLPSPVATAVCLLQSAHNTLFDGPLLVDGKLGPITAGAIAVVAQRWEKALLNAMNAEQYNMFKSIVVRDPSQKVFLRGWVGKRLDVPDDSREV